MPQKELFRFLSHSKILIICLSPLLSPVCLSSCVFIPRYLGYKCSCADVETSHMPVPVEAIWLMKSAWKNVLIF